ncbi:MptD family putative ECF transporter S component [Streptococcus massiliensis]|uniref:Major facilitator superfamily permease n=1 Tax=Streptococcus massiliensis TaxID=313439 RepID=A0A380KZV0_9STRE|nr:MptD family putative ECF transporter S component [Streptococcus massiliensis]SUN76647.1 major facilitator superfamily permease [Streptococcus massiliensis]
MKQETFTAKDLINAGLFSLLVFVATFIGGMFGLIPVLMPAIPFLCSFIAGPVFMLYSTKIHRFGMILIMGAITGLLFTVTGHGIYILPGIILLSLISEWILKQGHYHSVNHTRWALVVYSIYTVFNFIPIFIGREAYIQKLIDTGYGKKYAEEMMSVLPNWSLIPIVLLGCVGAYLGASLGIKLLNKHFKRAGMM